MCHDDLETRRAAALAQNKCFTKGRLRDEFRMKPAPGAEPVKIYKNAYGSKVCIDPSAFAVHGISADSLTDEPLWPDITRQLQHNIGQHPLIIFNADFDLRILKQTAIAHNDPASWLDNLTVYCAMWLSAKYYGPTNRYGTISLSRAVSQAGLSWVGQAHSAVTDAAMTAQVINDIAEYW
ncbi:3'-5' exonuclease [Enterobacteriaceae bacterium ESL0689]|nr:3'-5' exonuclease [Enterobacteriaceae bacterium ESL0689]